MTTGRGQVATGPYHVQQTADPDGRPLWRLAGPGLGETRPYPWQEVREKLDELAAVMNFAWEQGRQAGAGTPP